MSTRSEQIQRRKGSYRKNGKIIGRRTREKGLARVQLLKYYRTMIF